MTADPTLSRLVNAVLLPGFVGARIPDWLTGALDDGLGGILYFAHNLPAADSARTLSAAIHAIRPAALVASDEEGGDVTRLEAEHGSSLPGNAALGAVDDPALTARAAQALGRLQRAAGVDLDLAPSVDVNANPHNPVIGVRSFGADPELVARHAAAYVSGMQAAGVAACAKHFPGHGDTDVDSHFDLPVLDIDLDLLRRRDLLPFAAAVKAGVRALLTAHIRVPVLGDAPGTLNAAVTALARRDLGFDGVIVTDALDMQAVTRNPGFGEAVVQAAVAGADLLCLGNPEGRDAEADYRTAHDALTAAVRSGELPVARLEEAAERVAALSTWVSQRSAADEDRAEVDRDPAVELRAVGAEAAQRALRTVGDVRVASAPCVTDLRTRINLASGRNAQHLQSEFIARFADTECVDPVGEVGVGDVLAAAAGRPLVAVVREPHRDDDEGRKLAQLRAARPDLVVIYTGWPHAVDTAGDRVVVTYGAGRANARAAVAAMTGGRPVDGMDIASDDPPSVSAVVDSPTENRNPATLDIDLVPTIDVLRLINAADATVPGAVAEQLSQIAAAVDLAVACIRGGGRVHYFGSGTSGRLGVLDVAELLPTFGVGSESFVAHHAGGRDALVLPAEGAEDDVALGREAAACLEAGDLAVGLAASGRTPYVRGALDTARAKGVATVLISSNPRAALAELADVAVLVDTGPEVIMGSTRMKAGTAQKLVLNAFSTATMIRLGKTYSNLMVGLVATNEKLRGRMLVILMEATGLPEAECADALEAAAGEVPVALVALLSGQPVEAARSAFEATGSVRAALAAL